VTKLKTNAAALGSILTNGAADEKRDVVQSILHRIELAPISITLNLERPGLAKIVDVPCPSDTNAIIINIPVRLRRRGVETKLLIESPGSRVRFEDMGLCRLVAQSHLWFEQLARGEASTVREIAKREQVNEHEITRVLQLAFLSPKIIEDILSGRQGEGISIHHLRRFGSLPLDWADQAKLLNNLG
jgi:hypothetical protein